MNYYGKEADAPTKILFLACAVTRSSKCKVKGTNLET